MQRQGPPAVSPSGSAYGGPVPDATPTPPTGTTDPTASTSSAAPRPPAADLPADRARAMALLDQLVPEAGAGLSAVRWRVGNAPLGEGWDNTMWPVGETGEGTPLVLRMVRRRSARPLLDREVTVLRRLAAHPAPLPLRIPTPLARAEDALLQPWVPGVVAAEAAPAARRTAARDLADMLALLHRLPDPGPAHNPVRGVPPASRAGAVAVDLDRAALDADERRRATELWDRGLAAPAHTGPARLLHGDPHPGNLVLPRSGLGILIDWGDTTAGDPASDLGALLLHDPDPALLERYRAATGDEDEAARALAVRSWAWGARMALALLTAYPREHPLGAVAVRFLRAPSAARHR